MFRVTKKSSKKSAVGADDLDEEENIQVSNKEESTDVSTSVNSEFKYNFLIESSYLLKIKSFTYSLLWIYLYGLYLDV